MLRRFFATACTLSFGLALAAAAAHAQPGATPAGGARPNNATTPVAPSGTPTTPPAASQAPMGGRGFGEHVSGMAPEHPREHGVEFGQCVSEMAIVGECSHHEP